MPIAESKPPRLLCYYGDDFTGSTDVLESLFRSGVRTVLFLDLPDEEVLQGRFAGIEAFGIAGVGRALSPVEAEKELRPIFERFKQAEASVVHYKVCSTFDSSPTTGNIGKAAEIGRSVFGGEYVPILVGVPILGRYTLFGNHFAAAGEEIYRLDRHPTMSCHPVTPMKEADLRRHLAEQGGLKTALMDILSQDGTREQVQERLKCLVEKEQPDLVLFDVLDEERLEMAGRLIWEGAQRNKSRFVIGSSGIEYALGATWKAQGMLQQKPELIVDAPPVSRLLVLSGSCSPVTEQQIAHAGEAGFALLRVPAADLIHPERAEQARVQLLKEAMDLLEDGKSVLLYTASGAADPAIGAFRRALDACGYHSEDSSRLLGLILGSIAKSLIIDTKLKRIVIAGGDTSGYLTRELGIYALECMAAIVPGAPLCRASSQDPCLDGLELVLKGGQIGGKDFFNQVKKGSVSAN
ncbi:four-carbon acid sugar kinase family protein [Paenibacillus luteus]|uniref:four-carbon acid sugar kinase family protein n=1 Tax=Paenibacillus luteus TaxID=2545753 RepID=UPI00114356A5|nr:four-carbon acid sugar kinase family protein [Paenibacillus luteus]